MIVRQRVHTKQMDNRSHAFWQSPIQQVAFGSSSFTTFIGGSLALTIQPSLAPQSDATSDITPEPLTGFDVPQEVATLSERLVPRRYQRRTAPRLRGAETSVLPIFRLFVTMLL